MDSDFQAYQAESAMWKIGIRESPEVGVNADIFSISNR
jgi:hypothetical protein